MNSGTRCRPTPKPRSRRCSWGCTADRRTRRPSPQSPSTPGAQLHQLVQAALVGPRGTETQATGSAVGAQRGGLPAYPKAERAPDPPEQVRSTTDCKPTACRRCHHPLTGDDPEPLIHQVAEQPVFRTARGPISTPSPGLSRSRRDYLRRRASRRPHRQFRTAIAGRPEQAEGCPEKHFGQGTKSPLPHVSWGSGTGILPPCSREATETSRLGGHR